MSERYVLWFLGALQVVLSLYHVRNAKRCAHEWMRLRALNQLVWTYTKELIEKGVTLPPRCVMCCQILPRHVDGCLMGDEYMQRHQSYARIKYYGKGEHPPHPKEEPPPHV